jgi:hypothetical protein
MWSYILVVFFNSIPFLQQLFPAFLIFSQEKFQVYSYTRTMVNGTPFPYSFVKNWRSFCALLLFLMSFHIIKNTRTYQSLLFFYKNCIQIGSIGSRRFLKIRKNIIYILFFMILLKLWKFISIPIPFLQHSSYNINKFYPIRFNKISFSLREDDADESKILSMTIY